MIVPISFAVYLYSPSKLRIKELKKAATTPITAVCQSTPAVLTV